MSHTETREYYAVKVTVPGRVFYQTEPRSDLIRLHPSAEIAERHFKPKHIEGLVSGQVVLLEVVYREKVVSNAPNNHS